MGAAYFIVLNSDDPGFDTTVDGKALARHAAVVNAIATMLGFRSLDEYCSQSPADARAIMADFMELEDEEDLAPDAEETLANLPPEEWYEADHGIDFATQIANHIRRNPQNVAGTDAILYDLDTMLTVLRQAKGRELKWHLQVDF